MLHGNELKIMFFISEYYDEFFMMPLMTEIADALGFKRGHIVPRLMDRLEKQGYISREKHKYRGIKFTHS